MKRIFFTLLLGTLAAATDAQVTNTYTANPDAGIPAGAVGLTETLNVSGLTGTFVNLDVGLNITGGFNGNLYAYLTGPNGGFAVLLNRVGVTAANPFGYTDSGFAITLDDGGQNVHDYQSDSYSLNGSGQLTGVWAPDGRNIDPDSSGSAFDAAGTGANLGIFPGTNPDGTWTLFVTDMGSGGGTPELSSWSLSITTAPEPQTWAMFGGGLALLVCFRHWRRE